MVMMSHIVIILLYYYIKFEVYVFMHACVCRMCVRARVCVRMCVVCVCMCVCVVCVCVCMCCMCVRARVLCCMCALARVHVRAINTISIIGLLRCVHCLI